MINEAAAGAGSTELCCVRSYLHSLCLVSNWPWSVSATCCTIRSGKTRRPAACQSPCRERPEVGQGPCLVSLPCLSYLTSHHAATALTPSPFAGCEQSTAGRRALPMTRSGLSYNGSQRAVACWSCISTAQSPIQYV